ncbi:sugar ABC transporter substrate-binding protein [Paenibacillus sp. MWE-103]|uniref:Sugar ABC transporter substrate-binding protein n=1 Tax=Paenibacillus artemisiicola TaxID=1172618 RepID=A0ABS3W546_9BACL|nr:sugar ABC transporter substrate-binding protein [Paenibacillus artemisiicola]MBO7743260.1 sugar ABC transporter substrate-binding protein [Paenibacillus artemisiicola]
MGKKGWLGGMAAVLMLSGALTACGGNKADDSAANGGSNAGGGEKVELSYLDPLPSPERTAFLQDLLKKFEAQNPNITVDYTSVPWDQANNKWMTMGVAGILPDVISIDDTSLAGMASAGYIQSLQPFYDKWDQTANLTEAAKQARNKFNNEVYAIPDAFLLQGLFIRSDWFKDNGLPSTIDTWDDYFNYAKKLTDESKGRYGISFRGGANGIIRAMEYVMAATHSDGWFGKDGKSILYSAEGKAAFKKFYDLYLDGESPKESVNWGFNEMVQGFTTGQTAILNQTPEVIAVAQKNMQPDTWNVVPMPKSDDGKRYIFWGFTAAYAMSTNTKHKDEAWKLIEFLSSPENNLAYSKANSSIPIYAENLKDPFFSTGPIAGYAGAMADANIVFAGPPSYLTRLGEFTGTYSVQETQKYMTGAQDLDTTVKHLADWLTTEQTAYLKDHPQS